MKRRRLFPFPLPTAKGLAILGGAIIIPAAGFVGEVPIAQALAVLACYAAVAAILFTVDFLNLLRFLGGLSFGLSMPAVLYSGAKHILEIAVSCGKSKGVAVLLLRPENPDSILAEKQTYEVTVGGEQRRRSIQHVFTPLSRGKTEFSCLYCRASLGLKLARWQFVVYPDPPVEAEVYPNAQAVKSPARGLLKEESGSRLLSFARSEGREFDSLRKYSAGDDLRKVDWKRSAKGRGLMLKLYRPETHQRINIAMDCGRRMANAAGERSQIEYAADAAAVLTRLSRLAEDEIGLFAFNHQIVAAADCRRGVRQERRIIRMLAGLRPGPLESDYQLLTHWGAGNRRRSLLVLITTASNPAGFEQIRQALLPLRRKHLALVMAVADKDLLELAFDRAENLDQAYIIAAAAAQLTQIEEQIKIMERYGISCVYSSAENLAAALEKKYWELKTCGRL